MERIGKEKKEVGMKNLERGLRNEGGQKDTETGGYRNRKKQRQEDAETQRQ